MRTAACLLVLTLTLAAAPAETADRDRDRYQPRYGQEAYRHGFLIGFSVGAGGMAPDPCDECGVAAGGEVHLGAMASRSVAVVFEAAGVARGDLAHGMAGVGAQWWPDTTGRFWLKAGLGVGAMDDTDDCDFGCFDDIDFEDENGYVYPTVFGAAGFEFVRSGNFTMDIQVRGMLTDEPHRTARNLSVNVGFNWY
jgi:hypothetical protein